MNIRSEVGLQMPLVAGKGYFAGSDGTRSMAWKPPQMPPFAS